MLSQLSIGYELLGYGTTIRYEKRRSADLSPLPAGEGDPPFDHWLPLLLTSRTFETFEPVYHAARSELQHWRKRSEPAPEGETLEQMIDRLISDGEGWSARDAAIAFRCGATQVRRWRMERERNPETGREEGSIQHARELLSEGMSLRQVAMTTGIPRSTLHDVLKQGADRQGRV